MFVRLADYPAYPRVRLGSCLTRNDYTGMTPLSGDKHSSLFGPIHSGRLQPYSQTIELSTIVYWWGMSVQVEPIWEDTPLKDRHLANRHLIDRHCLQTFGQMEHILSAPRRRYTQRQTLYKAKNSPVWSDATSFGRMSIGRMWCSWHVMVIMSEPVMLPSIEQHVLDTNAGKQLSYAATYV